MRLVDFVIFAGIKSKSNIGPRFSEVLILITHQIFINHILSTIGIIEIFCDYTIWIKEYL